MNKPYLIVIEGQDRTGKDTLINNLVEKYGFYCYKQQEHEKTGVDYRNKEQYEKWVYNHIDKIYNDLLEISKTNKIILLSRLWISDNVYSDLFGRNHIVEKYFKDKFKDKFNIKTFILLWEDFDNYITRLQSINENIEYEVDEFNHTIELYKKYGTEQDKFLIIENTTSKNNILNNFITNILNHVERQ